MRPAPPLGIATLLLAIALLVPRAAHPQSAPLAGSEPLEIPDFEPPPTRQGTILPRVELPRSVDREGLQAGVRVRVEKIRVLGNEEISDEVLAEIVAPYEGRALGYVELEAVRDAVTLAYLSRGYISSGALLPDQSLKDGVLELRVIEGRLAEIEVTTEGWLRELPIEWRAARLRRGTVNVDRLEDGLLALESDARVKSLDARLEPGTKSGESVLRLNVKSARPWWTTAQVNNDHSPSIGAERGELRLGHRNATGYGDEVEVGYVGSEGLHGADATWEMLVGPWQSEIEVHFQGAWSDIVDDDFKALDIESRALTAGFELRQPLLAGSSLNARVSVVGEYRETESFLLGDPFTLQAGADEGLVRVWALRFAQDFSWRSQDQVVAGRSVVSVGLPLPSATDTTDVVSITGEDIPDDKFVSWLLQFQWVRRLPWRDVRIIARTDLQIADGALFGIEQLAVGGHATVRGYRENSLVRDNGLVSSVEGRVPVWSHGRGHPSVSVAPFVDVAYAWNNDRPDPIATTLLSAGLGVRSKLWSNVSASLYWGQPLLDIDNKTDWSLQDAGVHFRLEVRAP